MLTGIVVGGLGRQADVNAVVGLSARGRPVVVMPDAAGREVGAGRVGQPMRVRQVARGVVAMPQGTITKLVSDRGFGFISAERGEVFFHCSTVAEEGFDNLKEGQTVQYELDDGSGASRRGKGPRAASVKPI